MDEFPSPDQVTPLVGRHVLAVSLAIADDFEALNERIVDRFFDLLSKLFRVFTAGIVPDHQQASGRVYSYR